MNDRFEFDESSGNESLLSEDDQQVFEGQLQSVQPTPPRYDWSELESRLHRKVNDASAVHLGRDQFLRSSTEAPARPWRSHVAVGLVGMLSGAATMFLLLNALGWQADPRRDGDQVAYVDASQEKRVMPDETTVATNNTADGEADSMAVRDPAEERGMASSEWPTGSERDSRHQLQRDRLDSIVYSILDQDAALPPLTVGYGIVGLESGTRSGLEPREPTLEINIPRIPRSESDRETSRTASELLEEYLEDFDAGSRYSTTM
jgi:hypothetical protein